MESGARNLPVAAIAALEEGDKILAIKLVRAAHRLGLKDSLEVVEAHIALHPELQERFAAVAVRSRRGLLVVIALVAAVVAVVVASRMRGS